MTDKKQTTFSEFRNRFKSAEEFRKAFGQLSEEEAHALAAAEPAGITVKACIITTWQNCRKEVNTL